MQLRYTTEEILADHPGLKPNRIGNRLLHGGFDAGGAYVSPRTYKRWPAINAWREHFLAAGGELIDASTRLLQAPHYPNHAQMALLLQHGVTLPLWNSLSITGLVEARGRVLATITAPDFQLLVEEDIADSATAHLNRGLFAAHGYDEGGDHRNSAGAHDAMWYLARDLALGENAHPVPGVPDRGGRPGAETREMPVLPVGHEMLVKQLMSVLMIEIRAERGFAFNVALLRDPELFTDRRDAADEAADIVDQIRQDEAPHVAYLQLFVSELRHWHFRSLDGAVPGKSFIDPVWARIVAWNAEAVPAAQRAATRASVEACLQTVPNGLELFQRYEALADH